MDMLRQLITFEIYFYKRMFPVSPEEFRILGWALEKAGQQVLLNQVHEELSVSGVVPHGPL